MSFEYTTPAIEKWKINDFMEIIDRFEDALANATHHRIYVGNNYQTIFLIKVFWNERKSSKNEFADVRKVACKPTVAEHCAKCVFTLQNMFGNVVSTVKYTVMIISPTRSKNFAANRIAV